MINETSVAPQSEVNCMAGQSMIFGISISNMSNATLHYLTLSIQFYQDYLNGMHNYRLETRVVMSGPLRYGNSLYFFNQIKHHYVFFQH